MGTPLGENSQTQRPFLHCCHYEAAAGEKQAKHSGEARSSNTE
jgi:hypothetical protein